MAELAAAHFEGLRRRISVTPWMSWASPREARSRSSLPWTIRARCVDWSSSPRRAGWEKKGGRSYAGMASSSQPERAAPPYSHRSSPRQEPTGSSPLHSGWTRSSIATLTRQRCSRPSTPSAASTSTGWLGAMQRAPTLVIAGARDRAFSPELFRATAAGIPGARLILYPNCGHIGTMLNPRFGRDVAAFLDA